MKFGKTACYTILKNEREYIDKWLYYARPFDLRVLLDTGSTDGSWEYLQECARRDPGLIIEQKVFTPWRFDVARVYNLGMVPADVAWCLSPDLDEYFSINTHDEMERIIDAVPHITNISCDRLDIYSRTVRVGPPNLLATNKIHRRHDYTWKARVYEHLSWVHQDREECELYSDDIFLIHDQNFMKPERSPLYVDLMEQGWAEDPTDTWNNWFLCYYYFQSKQMDKYIPVAVNFIKYHKNPADKNYRAVFMDLSDILVNCTTLTDDQRVLIRSVLV